MADIVDAGEKIRIKVRLKMRIKKGSSVHVQLVLIRINHLAVRVLIHGFCHLIKRMGRNGVIVIGQNDKVAGSHLKSRVGVPGDSQIFAQNLVADPRILLGVFL